MLSANTNTGHLNHGLSHVKHNFLIIYKLKDVMEMYFEVRWKICLLPFNLAEGLSLHIRTPVETKEPHTALPFPG